MKFARVHYERRKELLQPLMLKNNSIQVEMAISRCKAIKAQYNNKELRNFYQDILNTLENPKKYIKEQRQQQRKLLLRQAENKRRNETIYIIIEGRKIEVPRYTTHRTDNYKKFKKLAGGKI